MARDALRLKPLPIYADLCETDSEYAEAVAEYARAVVAAWEARREVCWEIKRPVYRVWRARRRAEQR